MINICINNDIFNNILINTKEGVNMINFLDESLKIMDIMINIRRTLHMNPEIDRDLYNTGNLVEDYLKKYNIEYTRYSNNGIIAEIGNGVAKVVALRADMDALNVLDLKDVPYKSQRSGVMHACGHDAHTSILIGAAILLKSIETKLNGRVRFIFQPAEETDGGAKDMINYGGLDGVSAIAGLHVDETIDTGIIGVKRGVVCAASNPFEINIKGKGSHGAYPESGIDAIMIAAKVIDNLQSIISREISALDSSVITIGKISGGTSANAICSHVVMEGILRTLGNDLREFSKNRINQIVNDTALMYRATADVKFIESYPSFSNDDELYTSFNGLLSEMSNIDIIHIEKPNMSVEDFSYYTQRVPGLYYKLGCRNIDKGINHPAHGSYFDIDEDCLAYGCAVQAAFAYKYLKGIL